MQKHPIQLLTCGNQSLRTLHALRATREAVGQDDANSGLPFTGKANLRWAVADQLQERSGVAFNPETQVVITCGEGDAMVDVLFVATDPGDV